MRKDRYDLAAQYESRFSKELAAAKEIPQDAKDAYTVIKAKAAERDEAQQKLDEATAKHQELVDDANKNVYPNVRAKEQALKDFQNKFKVGLGFELKKNEADKTKEAQLQHEFAQAKEVQIRAERLISTASQKRKAAQDAVAKVQREYTDAVNQYSQRFVQGPTFTDLQAAEAAEEFAAILPAQREVPTPAMQPARPPAAQKAPPAQPVPQPSATVMPPAVPRAEERRQTPPPQASTIAGPAKVAASTKALPEAQQYRSDLQKELGTLNDKLLVAKNDPKQQEQIRAQMSVLAEQLHMLDGVDKGAIPLQQAKDIRALHEASDAQLAEQQKLEEQSRKNRAAIAQYDEEDKKLKDEQAQAMQTRKELQESVVARASQKLRGGPSVEDLTVELKRLDKDIKDNAQLAADRRREQVELEPQLIQARVASSEAGKQWMKAKEDARVAMGERPPASASARVPSQKLGPVPTTPPPSAPAQAGIEKEEAAQAPSEKTKGAAVLNDVEAYRSQLEQERAALQKTLDEIEQRRIANAAQPSDRVLSEETHIKLYPINQSLNFMKGVDQGVIALADVQTMRTLHEALLGSTKLLSELEALNELRIVNEDQLSKLNGEHKDLGRRITRTKEQISLLSTPEGAKSKAGRKIKKSSEELISDLKQLEIDQAANEKSLAELEDALKTLSNRQQRVNKQAEDAATNYYNALADVQAKMEGRPVAPAISKEKLGLKAAPTREEEIEEAITPAVINELSATTLTAENRLATLIAAMKSVQHDENAVALISKLQAAQDEVHQANEKVRALIQAKNRKEIVAPQFIAHESTINDALAQAVDALDMYKGPLPKDFSKYRNDFITSQEALLPLQIAHQHIVGTEIVEQATHIRKAPAPRPTKGEPVEPLIGAGGPTEQERLGEETEITGPTPAGQPRVSVTPTPRPAPTAAPKPPRRIKVQLPPPPKRAAPISEVKQVPFAFAIDPATYQRGTAAALNKLNTLVTALKTEYKNVPLADDALRLKMEDVLEAAANYEGTLYKAESLSRMVQQEGGVWPADVLQATMNELENYHNTVLAKAHQDFTQIKKELDVAKAIRAENPRVARRPATDQEIKATVVNLKNTVKKEIDEVTSQIDDPALADAVGADLNNVSVQVSLIREQRMQYQKRLAESPPAQRKVLAERLAKLDEQQAELERNWAQRLLANPKFKTFAKVAGWTLLAVAGTGLIAGLIYLVVRESSPDDQKLSELAHFKQRLTYADLNISGLTDDQLNTLLQKIKNDGYSIDTITDEQLIQETGLTPEYMVPETPVTPAVPAQ